MAAQTFAEADAPRVQCPGCREQCLYAPSNKWRPFCSARCRAIDLGAWASERYRVGSPADPALDPQDPQSSGDPS